VHDLIPTGSLYDLLVFLKVKMYWIFLSVQQMSVLRKLPSSSIIRYERTNCKFQCLPIFLQLLQVR